MRSIKLTYFPFTGRAEATRLTPYIGGIEFEDERVSRSKITRIKFDGAFTIGSVPEISIDGEMHAQSNAMLRYAGKLSGLYPEDPLLAIRVDEIVDVCDDDVRSSHKRWLECIS